MGGSHSQPGCHAATVRIGNAYHGPSVGAAYSETLKGYITEMEWHHLTTQLAAVAKAAGSEEARGSAPFWGSLGLMIVGVVGTSIMTPISCALQGASGFWCKAGIGATTFANLIFACCSTVLRLTSTDFGNIVTRSLGRARRAQPHNVSLAGHFGPEGRRALDRRETRRNRRYTSISGELD